MKRFAKLLPLLLLSALLCACQPQSEAPSSSAFSVTFATIAARRSASWRCIFPTPMT